MSNTTSLANGSQPGALGSIPVHINLPPEIRYNIVGAIQYNSVYVGRRSLILDLLSCCIASKQWRDAAVPFLAKIFEYLDFDYWPNDYPVLKQRISQLLDVSPQTLMCCVTVELSISIPRFINTDTRNFDEAFIHVIRMLPGLKTIKLSMKETGYWIAIAQEYICQHLARIQAAVRNKVTELIASKFDIFEAPFSLFQPIFTAMPKLRKVQLNVLSNIEVDVFEAISQGSPHIEVLELSLNTRSDIHLEEFVGAWSGLRVLKFNGNEMASKSSPNYVTEELLDKLANNCHKLEEFRVPQKFLRGVTVLDQPQVSRSWENSLYSMISCCQNIRKLDLTNRGISDTTLTTLVTRMPLLENLKLRCCRYLTGKSLLPIDTATLAQINLLHLQFLDLRGCQLLDPAAIQLLASSAPSLKVLKLPSALNNHAGLATHFETVLNLLQDEDENPHIKTRRWVKAEGQKNAGQRKAERGEKEEEDGDFISELIQFGHQFD